MDDRWLSMKEICAYLGVSHDTISRWIANHDMPSIKMGKCWKCGCPRKLDNLTWCKMPD